jgi:hypothetical protein
MSEHLFHPLICFGHILGLTGCQADVSNPGIFDLFGYREEIKWQLKSAIQLQYGPTPCCDIIWAPSDAGNTAGLHCLMQGVNKTVRTLGTLKEIHLATSNIVSLPYTLQLSCKCIIYCFHPKYLWRNWKMIGLSDFERGQTKVRV